MEKSIRLLTKEDFCYLNAMETGIENDYVKRIFDRLVSGNNRLYGLFWDDQLVSIGGYSIFADRYAMLGRMRSDIRYRGNDLSTQLMAQVREEAFKLQGIKWVGANTQEENTSARRVLQKIGLTEHIVIHGATATNVSILEQEAKPWKKVQNLDQKKEWVEKAYIKTGAIFPFECYYPFPASKDLFSDEHLAGWTFYENEEATRILIMKKDVKGHHYLQTIYPWDDLMDQSGLWETISKAYQELLGNEEEESYIWMDLTKQQVASLPKNHPFTLPSPWILHGTSRNATEKEKGA